MSVLYRKYRPQTFADVTGQDHVTQTLVAAVAAGRVAHAYLFSGPRGVGKTTSARLIAKAVNCEARKPESSKAGKIPGSPALQLSSSIGEPCNTCQACIEITEGRCLDVVEIDAASNTQVEKVREGIIETVRIAPATVRRKVFIIDEVHMLSTASFNALLKTIEEPPAHVLFILATTELHKVPETIRSRCQHFAFHRVGTNILEPRLAALASAEGVTVEHDVLAAIARAADGSVRDAETLLGQLIALHGDRISMEDAAMILPRSSIERATVLVQSIERADAQCAIAELRVASESGFDADAYLRDIMIALRDRIHAIVGGSNGDAAVLAVALRQFADLANSIHRMDQQFFAIEVIVLGLLAARVERHANDAPPAFTVRPPRATSRGVESETVAPRQEKPVRVAVEQPVVKSKDEQEESRAAASPPTLSMADGDRVLATVRSAWSAILMQLGEQFPSLSYLLEGGRPQQCADGVLTIGFRYKLYAEKLRDPRVIGAVTDAIIAVAGAPLRVATVTVNHEEFTELDAFVRPKTGDTVADAALEVFGGHVVQ